MPIQWEIRGAILVLAFSAIVENAEIESAVAAALADPRARPGMRLLWDGRLSQTPLSADDLRWRFDLASSLADRGLIDRAAVLLAESWRATIDYFRTEASRMAPNLPLAMFVDEAEAMAWLNREAPGEPGA